MRQPKPFFRKFTQSWYVTIDGKQYPLGRDDPPQQPTTLCPSSSGPSIGL